MLTDPNMLAFISKLLPLNQQQVDTPNTVDPMFESRINEMFNLKHEASDRLNQYSQSAPTREQYAPGKLRQIGGFLANLGSGGPAGIDNGSPIGYRSNIPGGLNVQRSILNEPYDRAVDDYQMKLKPLAEAAESEGRLNTANRQVGTSLLVNERQIKAERDREKDRDAKNKLTEEKIDISRQRAMAYDWKTRNPDYKSFVDDQGKLVFVNPKNPSDIKQTGIDTGKLSDADKLALQIEGRLKVVDAQSKSAKELETEREANREALERVKGTNRTTLKTTPKPSDTKPPSEAAQAKARIAKAKELSSKNPSWDKYFEYKNGDVKVKPNSLFRGNEVEHKAVMDAFYGTTKPTITSRFSVTIK